MLYIMANMPMAHLVPRCVCLVATATFLWMKSSHLQPRIWLIISRRNRMMMPRRAAQIHEASRQQKQASKGSKGRFTGGLSECSDSLKSSETVLLVPWQLGGKCCCWWGVALATGPGNPPAVGAWTGNTVWLGSRHLQTPDPLCVGCVVTQTGHQPAVVCLGKTRTAVPLYCSPTFAPIKNPSSDRIKTWSVRRLSSFSRSCTSCCQICEQTNIHWITLESNHIVNQIRRLSIATQWILVCSQMWQWDGKERLKLQNVHIHHVVIRSELRYLVRAKSVNWKWRVFGGKTGPWPNVRVFGVGRPIATVRFRVGPEPESTREFWPVANTDEEVAWLCEHYRIVNPPAAGYLDNRKQTRSHQAAN